MSMTRFLIRRLGQSVAVLMIVTLVVFALLESLPGGPARAILGPRASAGALALFDHNNGYDKPLVVQYVDWLGRLLHGNLGYSYKYNQSVVSLLGTFLPKTLVLVGLATFLAIVLAVPIGILQASRRNSLYDYFTSGVELAFYSMPTFFLGMLLIVYLAVDNRVFPAEAPQGTTISQVLSDPRGLVLPVVTLMLITVALFARYTRSAALDVLVQDFIRTAMSKGASRGRILRLHVLRNAVAPLATLIGVSLPVIIGGAVVTETLFNYPGMGLAFWTAAQDRDFGVLLGFTLISGIATVLGSLLADIAYAVLDPRVRLR
jgi:peptide/nickel transport system permease protein